MSEAKDTKSETKSQVDRLVSDYGAQDIGTYMDARVEEKVIRVAVWNEGLKSYQPTDEGIALLATPKPAAKPAAKPATSSAPTMPPPGPLPPPPGTRAPG